MKTWLVQLATQALIRVFLKTSVIRWGTIEVFYVYKLFFFYTEYLKEVPMRVKI